MRIVTHNGDFHADDVFAVGTLLHLYPDAEIVRTRDEEIIKTGDIVVDVGKMYDTSTCRFDHHQAGGAGVRANGIPYASFGLVWKEFGEKVCGSIEVAEMVTEKLVLPIDALDNGVSISTPLFPGVREYAIHDFFYSFRDYSDSSDGHLLEVFIRIAHIAKELLARELSKAALELDDMQEVRKILEAAPDKRIIILEKELAWKKVLTPIPETLFVVYPRKDGKWGVRAVRKMLTGFEVKKELPETWVGKNDEELIAVTGVPDVVFVHNARFLAVAQSREGAVALAEKAVNA